MAKYNWSDSHPLQVLTSLKMEFCGHKTRIFGPYAYLENSSSSSLLWLTTWPLNGKMQRKVNLKVSIPN
jgi:hypothetical protein